MKRVAILSLMAITSLSWAKDTYEAPISPPPNSQNVISPWFTGPLLTPSANVITAGHFNIEPYIYYGSTNAQYNSQWHARHTPTFTQLRIQVPIQVGVTQWMDIAITPQVIHSWSQGAATTNFCDLPLQLDFQLLRDLPGWNWHPSLRFSVRESFPTGEYQKRNPNKFKTDISGSGSFATTLGLVVGKLLPFFSGVHYLNTRFNVAYTYPAPVHVRGFNTYGGGFGTAGKVYPGNIFNFLLGLEYSMTQRWVLALDAACTLSTKTRFSGAIGSSMSGAPAQIGNQPSDPLSIGTSDAVVGGPASARFSLAPALEYNWNANLGLIVGASVSVGGRNSVRYAAGIAAFNYYY